MNQAVDKLIEAIETREIVKYGDLFRADDLLGKQSYKLGYIQSMLANLCNKFPEVEAYVTEYTTHLQGEE